MQKNLPVWPKRFLLALLVFGTLLFGQDSGQLADEPPDNEPPAYEPQEALPEETAFEFSPVPPDSQWYRSNASGMMLELSYSRAAALRNEYALAVSLALSAEIPPLLIPYNDSSFSVELRTLFENGVIKRQQWIFRDFRGVARLNASGTAGLFYGDDSEGVKGFIEVYDENHTMIEERIFSGASETLSLFTYSGSLLIKAETWIKDPSAETVSDAVDDQETIEDALDQSDSEALEDVPGQSDSEALEDVLSQTDPETLEDASGQTDLEALEDAPGQSITENFQDIPEAAEWGPPSPPDITDYYRYTRSSSLRAIERVYHSGLDSSERRIPFPSLSPIFPKEPEFENPTVAYSSEFLEDVIIPPEGRVIYATDNRGRVLSERRLDENGELLGELVNIWAGDRLVSVSWKSGDDEWLIEYEYDDQGNRILERNFNRGVLERVVSTDGDREVEDLYMNGRVILQAIWVDGRKISEERIRNR